MYQKGKNFEENIKNQIRNHVTFSWKCGCLRKFRGITAVCSVNSTEFNFAYIFAYTYDIVDINEFISLIYLESAIKYRDTQYVKASYIFYFDLPFT